MFFFVIIWNIRRNRLPDFNNNHHRKPFVPHVVRSAAVRTTNTVRMCENWIKRAYNIQYIGYNVPFLQTLGLLCEANIKTGTSSFTMYIHGSYVHIYIHIYSIYIYTIYSKFILYTKIQMEWIWKGNKTKLKKKEKVRNQMKVSHHHNFDNEL